jgi:magnesium transporter
MTLSCRAHDGTSCVAHTRAYRDGQVVEEGFDVALVSDHLEQPGTVVWLDLQDPTPQDLDVLVEELGLHPLAVEDAVHASQRPKLDQYTDHLFLSAYVVEKGDEGLETHEVAAFLTAKAMVTVRRGDALPLKDLLSRWDGGGGPRESGVAYLLHGLLDLVVDSHFSVSEGLDDEVDELEDLLFADRPQVRELQRQAFVVRKSLVTLRRVALPMREVVNSLIRRDMQVVGPEMGPYFQDVYDHVLRVAERTDSARDLLTSILETNLTLQGNRLNEVMKSLTAGAAILAVTTAVTGFYGQNVPYPGYQAHSGFVTSTVLLLGMTAGLYYLFKRRGWL